MSIDIVEILEELRRQFGNTTELIFFQSDLTIQARIKVFSSGEKGFYNYAFNFSLQELNQVDIFKEKFNCAVEALKNHIKETG
jgi:hypothetical protein